MLFEITSLKITLFSAPLSWSVVGTQLDIRRSFSEFSQPGVTEQIDGQIDRYSADRQIDTGAGQIDIRERERESGNVLDLHEQGGGWKVGYVDG